MTRVVRLARTSLALLLIAGCVSAPTALTDRAERATAARFERLKATPPQLTAFLRAMPKGGDLHSHLSGAVYAESYIAWAIADGRCLVVATQTIAAAPCNAAAGRPPLRGAVAGTAAYNALIDALSVRNYERRPVSGHDQFFATFARFSAAGDGRAGDMQAEVMARAADQNILYLELMNSAGMAAARALGKQVGWNDDPEAMFAALKAAGLDAVARDAGNAFAAIDARARALLHCGMAAAAPGCNVGVRYIAQVIRIFPEEQVFAQIALGFLLASHDPRVVGLNLVAPEDDRVSLADYSAHMRMIGALHRLFPAVHVSLHAGELAPGLVPPKDLRFHVAEAVRVAGAARIGHGVDIMHEDDPIDLLREMARKRVMVEINLTSNDVILGVTGSDHPFMTYRAYDVPLALSTDDEGVSRIDLTHEYRRAVLTYGLGYDDVKALSRNSLTYAFVGGASLWADADDAVPVTPCHEMTPGNRPPAAACAAFLAGSPKARLQWALEAAFARFEAREADIAP